MPYIIRSSVHSVVEIPVENQQVGRKVPILILQNGTVSLFALTWAREMMVMESRSPSHLYKSVCAVGLLYDFYVIVYKSKPLAFNELRGMMRLFFEAREYGNSELGWKPVRKKTALDDVRNASFFSKFCSDNFGTTSVNPFEAKLISDLNVSNQLQFYAETLNRPKWDMLSHLYSTTSAGQGLVSQFSFKPKSNNQSSNTPKKHFPPEKIIPLLLATDNLRDLLCFILMFFAAFRISELLHLYVTDVTTPGYEPDIRIADPELSIYEWSDPFLGSRSGNRSTFLLERYGIAPRHKLGLTDPLHAGWKGMLYTKNNYEAELFWLIPEVGPIFTRLHRNYMHNCRTGIEDTHPYYFINLNGESFGSPLKIANLTKGFYRAAARVGLSPSDPGVNPHGARHFYGYFCANHLQVPMTDAQRMMRHALISSTAVYYKLDDRLVRQKLSDAQEKMREEIPDFIRAITNLAERLV